MEPNEADFAKVIGVQSRLPPHAQARSPKTTTLVEAAHNGADQPLTKPYKIMVRNNRRKDKT